MTLSRDIEPVSGDNRSVPELFSSLVTEMSTLVRQEIRLVQTESSEKVGQVIGAAVLLGVGAVLMIPALVILLQAIAAFLVAHGVLTIDWANLAVSVVVIVIGLILLGIGSSRLKAANLVPERTIQQVQRDAATAKDQIR